MCRCWCGLSGLMDGIDEDDEFAIASHRIVRLADDSKGRSSPFSIFFLGLDWMNGEVIECSS